MEPSIKRAEDRDAILKPYSTDGSTWSPRITPRIPWKKKCATTFRLSGGPLVQHLLPALFEFVKRGTMRVEDVVDRTSHAVADLFRIVDRGYIREGY